MLKQLKCYNKFAQYFVLSYFGLSYPLSYPSTLHFPKYHLLLRNISPYFSPVPTAKMPSLIHQLLPTNVMQVYVTSLSIPSYLKTSHLINNLLAFINATTHVASLAHFSKKAKPLTLFSPPKKHVKLLTTYLAIPKISST